MRKFYKKSLAVLLVLLLASVMVLAGCSNKSQSSNADGDGGNSGKRITLTIELFDRSNTPAGAPPIDDNFMTQYVQKNFGDPNNIDVKFVTVPRSEEVQKLNALMATKSAPDLVFTYDKPTVQNYAQSGGLIDLGPYIEEHGQQLKKVLAPTLSDGIFEGKQYAIPALRVIQAQTSTFIRKDWLDKLDLPLPTTTEQWYEAMKAFKEQDPGGTGGKVIPYTQIDVFHLKPLVNSFWEWSQISEEDLFADPDGWTQPGNKDAYRFLNKMYHEGLLDPDFPLQADFSEVFYQQVVTGIAGSATPNTNEPVYNGYYANLKQNDPDAVLATIDPFTTKDGKRPKPMFSPSGIYLMVPVFSKNAEAVVKYLDWMAQPENILTLQLGQKGVSYDVDEDGIPFALTTPEANELLYNNQDYAMIMNGKYLSPDTPERNIAANATVPEFRDFTVESIQAGMNDGYIIPRVDIPVQAEIKYSTILSEKMKSMLASIVTADPADFDRVYEEQVKEWMDAGGREMVDEKRKAYQEFYK